MNHFRTKIVKITMNICEGLLVKPPRIVVKDWNGLTNGPAVMKYHFIDGLSSKVSTFIPKKLVRKDNGKKTKVTHDSLHMLVPKRSES